MSRLRRAVGAVVAVVAASVLAACAAIPTSGPVRGGNLPPADEPPGIDLQAAGPQEGAGPEDIVNGFLLAGSAGFPDFVVARQFLAGPERSSWRPLDGVVVAGDLTPRATTDTEVSVDVPVLARIDADGRYAEAAPDAHETVTYGMVRQDDGEWRIASAPDGVILPQIVFETQFRSAQLYFLSPDSTYLVPDTRWFPARNIATSAVVALLAGPSPWLRDAVRTAVPNAVTLKPAAVLIDSAGVAQVGLDPPAPVLAANRLMVAQIEATLLPLAGVGAVQVSTGGVLVDAGGQTPLHVTAPGGDVEFLQDGTIMRMDGTAAVPVPGVVSLDGLSPSAPARNDDGSVRVMLSGSSDLVTVPTTQAPSQTIVSAVGLVPPSVDRFGWAWTAGTFTEGPVAARVGEPAVAVQAGWLAGRIIRSIRVSADGARLAVVSSGADGAAVEVAAIVRDAAGAPQQLGEPVRVGAALTDATSVTWSDEVTLVVAGRSGTPATAEAVHYVPVAGLTEALPELPSVASVAAGRGLYVATDDGELRRLNGPTWVRVPDLTDVRDPYYPG